MWKGARRRAPAKMIHRAETIELLWRLVGTDSVNPSLVPGGRGEAQAALLVRDWLRERGVAADLQQAVAPRQLRSAPQFAPGTQGGAEDRPNVVATVGPAEALRPALLIVAHLDTVGAGDMPDPFSPRERDGRLYGRGALDIKSGVAAMCAAAVSLVRDGAALARPFVIAAVVDEECNSIGTEALLKQCIADAAVVIEPTDLRVCIAHKGYAWMEIVTRGRAAHGSMPGEGRDAIRMMGRVLGALDQLEQEIASRPPHPLLGRGSLHASLISGGHELSSYPAECRLQIERRTLPGETDDAIKAEVDALLSRLRERGGDFRAESQLMSSRPPYAIDRGSEIAQAVAGASRDVIGRCEFFGMPVWTDTALLGAGGIPGVVFGPAGRGLHGADEYVELESVMQCAEILRETILHRCAC